MKQGVLLAIASVLSIVLLILRLVDDSVGGFGGGRLSNLRAMPSSSLGCLERWGSPGGDRDMSSSASHRSSGRASPSSTSWPWEAWPAARSRLPAEPSWGLDAPRAGRDRGLPRHPLGAGAVEAAVGPAPRVRARGSSAPGRRIIRAVGRDRCAARAEARVALAPATGVRIGAERSPRWSLPCSRCLHVTLVGWNERSPRGSPRPLPMPGTGRSLHVSPGSALRLEIGCEGRPTPKRGPGSPGCPGFGPAASRRNRAAAGRASTSVSR